MSEIDKQQENIPTPEEPTSPTSKEGLEDNAGETPTPSKEGGNGGNSSQEIDWELQVAQAYQQAEASSSKEEAKAVPKEEKVKVEAQEVANLKEAKESLQAQMEAMQAQFEDVSSQYKRLAADFDNYRKRTQKEKEELDLQVKCTTITKLLPIVDNFERARSQIKPQNEGEMNIHKSYQSVYKQMVDSLKQIGVSPMRPEGQEFDPNFHEAVMREQTSEYPEGTVTEELVRGYVLGDRILRHAMVKVAAAPEEPMATEESPPEIQEEPS
jgi:molecular chaperone GrpE